MIRTRLQFFFLLVWSLFLSTVKAERLTFAQAVKKAAPSVVSIQCERSLYEDFSPFLQDPFFKQFFEDPRFHEPSQKIRALGSGFIISEKGYILTNYHVIKEASALIVKLDDGREFKAKVVACDPPSDVGVIKIEGNNLPVAVLGNSENIAVGDIALAIGNPFGVGQTVTQGIVSALHRKNLGINLYEGYIQTDAAINPGNSGGPLIDADGKVIGINTAILTRSGANNGIGFAIPITYAQQIMDDLIHDGQVSRGWIGIVMADLNPDIRESFHFNGQGVLVRAVYGQSPAAQAGILPGDIIIKINNQAIKDSSDVRDIVTRLKSKQKSYIVVNRDGQEISFSVIVGHREPIE
jgi:Do/DeqQ family serine protease